MARSALGLIETQGLVAAIEATDAAAKAAGVVVASAELTDATFITIRIEGELGAVQAAVQAGAEAAAKVGEVIAVHVIPRPDDGLDPILPSRRYVSKYHPDDDRPPLAPSGQTMPPPRPKPPATTTETRRESTPEADRGAKPDSKEAPAKKPLAEMMHMSVVELRRYARLFPRLELKGREISRASKQQLLEAIKRMLEMD